MKHWDRLLALILLITAPVLHPSPARADAPEVGASAPLFQAQTDEGRPFDLAQRKGQWTVLYFYPKAETPGCTKQACAFRDSIAKVRALHADVIGVSADEVTGLAAFKKHHHLNFTLLADPKAQVIEKYSAKMPMIKMAKRWTYIIDPELKIRFIEKDVDPVKDADRTAAIIARLQEQALH